MSNQKYILVGIVIFILGFTIDLLLIPFSSFLLYLGTGITLFGVFNWMRLKENRKQLKEVIKPKSGFSEMIQDLFDFRWSKISIIWTVCGLGFMTIVHLGALMMKNNGAYQKAITEIEKDSAIRQRTGGIQGINYMVTGNFTTNGYSNLNIGVIGKSESFYVNAKVFGEAGEYYIDEIKINEK